jgi:hypothetical protein
MNKRLFAVLAFAVPLFSCHPTAYRIYKPKDFNSRTADHNTIAILPAMVTITLQAEELKKTTVEKRREMEYKTGISVQEKMFAWFIKRSEQMNYTVNFQDIKQTNDLLQQAGIKYENMAASTIEELAKVLGVDAVITTKLSMQKPMDDGMALAFGVMHGNWNSTNHVQTTFAVNEAQKGDLVWKCEYTASGSVGSNANKLVDVLMRGVSKRFPYNAR